MTALLIREPPPMRLDVQVTPPSGPPARWGLDDPEPANQPQELTFSTAMPGGFDSLSCTLARDPQRTYPDAAELSDVKVFAPGHEIHWEGRVQELPDQGGSTSSLSPQAVGYQAALDDQAGACMIYIDAQLGSWGDMPLARQQSLQVAGDGLGSQSSGSDASGNPRMILEVDGAWAANTPPVAEAWYQAAAGCLIQQVYYTMTLGAGVSTTSFWVESVSINAANSDGSIGANLATTGNLIGGSTSASLAAATPGAYAFIHHFYNSTNAAGTDGFAYQTYWQLAAIGNHGMTIHGTWPTYIGVLASDVIAHAISTWAPQIQYTSTSLQASSFIIPQLTFTDPSGTASTIIKQAAAYELLDWAIWEGPTLYLNQRGQSPKTRNWRTRVRPCQLQDTGPDITRVWNGAIVGFTAADGTAQTIGPPGSGATTESALLLDTDPQNPANQATANGQPLKRWAPLSLGTANATIATQVAQVYLAEQKLLNGAGQATLVGPVEDADTGQMFPPSAVRAGDNLIVADARDPSPRRIVSTSYTHSSRSNAVQLDQPPDAEAALLERISAAISPLGLG